MRSFPASMASDGSADPRTAAFTRTVDVGFYEPWLSDAEVDRWVASHVEDGQELTGVYVDRGASSARPAPPWRAAWEQVALSDDHPVGTFVEYDKTLNAGGSGPDGPLLGARLITEVTVDPGFRRRGIFKHLMTASLSRAVEAGVPVALLTVSEGGIYGRFGFGVATREARIQADLGMGSGEDFHLRPPAVGRVFTADPQKLGGVIDEVWATHHGRTRGSVDRQAYYRRLNTGAWDPEEITSRNKRLRAAVHIRDDGAVGGYVTYRHEGWDIEPSTIRIIDLIAVDSLSRIELWRHLADLDVVRRAVMRTAPVDDVVPGALVDPRSWRITGVRDVLWVRILDVAQAFRARAWGEDGEFLLEVDDSLGIIAGRYRVRVHQGVGDVELCDDAIQPKGQPEQDPARLPRMRLDAETLGSLFLGDVSVETLDGSRRIDGAAQDVSRISRIMDLPTRPHCATHF